MSVREKKWEEWLLVSYAFFEFLETFSHSKSIKLLPPIIEHNFKQNSGSPCRKRLHGERDSVEKLKQVVVGKDSYFGFFPK
jgi:hypothetical protein